jgi:hypothetical protein
MRDHVVSEADYDKPASERLPLTVLSCSKSSIRSVLPISSD